MFKCIFKKHHDLEVIGYFLAGRFLVLLMGIHGLNIGGGLLTLKASHFSQQPSLKFLSASVALFGIVTSSFLLFEQISSPNMIISAAEKPRNVNRVYEAAEIVIKNMRYRASPPENCQSKASTLTIVIFTIQNIQ